MARELVVPLERFVQVGDVGGVMAIVMDLHRTRVDVWLERVEAVGQVGKLVHLEVLLLLVGLRLFVLESLDSFMLSGARLT